MNLLPLLTLTLLPLTSALRIVNITNESHDPNPNPHHNENPDPNNPTPVMISKRVPESEIEAYKAKASSEIKADLEKGKFQDDKCAVKCQKDVDCPKGCGACHMKLKRCVHPYFVNIH